LKKPFADLHQCCSTVSALNEFFVIVKNDEGRMVSTARHTSAHTSAEDGAASGLSQSTQVAHPRRHRCPHLFTKYFSYQTTKRAGSLASQGSWPAPTILAILSGDLGAGSRSRYATTAIDGSRKSKRFPLLYVRVGRCRQTSYWLVSNPNNRQTAALRASRPGATRRSSGW
jgi:hypothetical protein